MGTCIICGTDVDGHICESHEEDVVFEFRGDSPQDLVAGRFYRGTVDGYADFGVFVDLAPGVTGLLHRSELDQRLESLEWEPGDEVFVQVKNVRDNGNVDLGWSIRQAEREFRGSLVQGAEGDRIADDDERDSTAQADDDGEDRPDEDATTVDPGGETGNGTEAGGDGQDVRRDHATEPTSREADPTAESDGTEAGDAGPEEGEAPAVSGSGGDPGERSEAGIESAAGTDTGHATRTGSESAATAVAEVETETDAGSGSAAGEEVPAGRTEIGTLSNRVGETVRIEGEVVGARQTGGPTVFELRDETGVVDCAAFVEAGVRAYPEIDVGDIVRLDGDVEVRRNEIQVETEALVALDGEEREAVERRLAESLTDEARPEEVRPLAGHEPVEALAEPLGDAAEEIRRAVLESRPVVVRHAATADGYVAGAAVERAVLPLIREEHATSDAVYHYFTRRPLEDPLYDMDAATNDVTRMLQDRDRHDEKLPLVLMVGTGSTVESRDGLDLLGIYGARRVVVDAAPADEEIEESTEVLVTPGDADVDAGDLSTGALAGTLATAVNDEVREDLAHLPAVSYWEDTPEAYVELAEEAGYAPDRVAELREAVALEAYYQSYEDKRELVEDLLFGEPEPPSGAPGDVESLAGHIAAQFREKLEDELDTAGENVRTHETGGVRFAVLDADAFTHRFDFPPTTLLLDELHRRLRESPEEAFVTLGIGTDELYIRSTRDLDVRAVAEDAAELAPEAGVTALGVRQNRIEFLSGAREDVENAVVAAVTDRFFD